MTDQTIPKKKRRTKEQVAADLTAAQVALQLTDWVKSAPKVKKPRVQKPKVIAPVLPTPISFEECPVLSTPLPQVLKSPGVNIYGDFSITEVKAPKTFWQKLKDFLFS